MQLGQFLRPAWLKVSDDSLGRSFSHVGQVLIRRLVALQLTLQDHVVASASSHYVKSGAEHSFLAFVTRAIGSTAVSKLVIINLKLIQLVDGLG